MLLKIGLLFLLFVSLTLGTRLTVTAFEKLVSGLSAKRKMIVASLFVALSTSLPELFVTLAAAFEGRPEIALSTVLGSNVVDLSLVIGGAALVGGSLAMVGEYWHFELAAAFMAGVAPILLMMDGALSRLDGFILIVIYLIYLDELVLDGREKSLVKVGAAKHGFFMRLKDWRDHGGEGSLFHFCLGIFLMLVSADLVVKLTVDLAQTYRLSVIILGFLVVSVGTSLPELALSVAAAAKKSIALILGNLLGSIVTNATLIIGLLAIIRPFGVSNLSNYSLVNVAFVVVFGVFWLFSASKKKLERWEGLVLVGLFFVFAGLQILLPVF